MIIQYLLPITIFILEALGIYLGFKLRVKFQKRNLPWIQARQYVWSMLDSFKDILTLIGTILILPCVFQIWSLIEWTSNNKHQVPYRNFVLVQLVLSYLDVLCFIPAVGLLGFPWRLYNLIQLDKEKHKLFPPQSPIVRGTTTVGILRSPVWRPYLYRRAQILIQFVAGIMDLPFLIALAILLLTGWRAESTWLALKNRGTKWYHQIIAEQFVQWLIDIPFVLIVLVLLCSGYKSYVGFSIISSARKNKAGLMRKLILEQFLCLIFDPVSFVCCGLLFLTWDVIESWQMFTNYSWRLHLTPGTALKWNRQVFLLFTKFLVIELVFYLCFLIVALTGLRLPSLYKNMKLLMNDSKLSKSQYKMKRNMLSVELLICLVFDPIAWPLYSLLWLTKWNWDSLKSSESTLTNKSLYSWHLLVFSHSIWFFVDMPFHVMLLILSITLIRAFTTWNILRTLSVKIKSSPDEILNIKRKVIWEQFICLLLDPLALVGEIVVVCLRWRSIDLMNDKMTFRERFSKLSYEFQLSVYHQKHMIIISHLMKCLFDLPAIGCYLIVFVTFYRYSTLQGCCTNLWNDYQKQKLSSSQYHSGWHRESFSTFRNLCLDIFLVVFGIFVIVFYWHSKEFLRKFKESSGFACHKLAAKYFVLTIVDLPIALCAAIIVITQWRYNLYCRELAKADSALPQDPRRFLVLNCMEILIQDLLCCFVYLTYPWTYSAIKIAKQQRGDVAGVREWKNYNFKILCIGASTVIDIPFFLPGLVVLFSWRSLSFIRAYRVSTNLENQRATVIYYYFCLMLDIPVLISYGLVWITCWRWSALNQELSTAAEKFEPGKNLVLHKHWVVLKYGFSALKDIPASISVIFLYSSWRMFNIQSVLYDGNLTISQKQKATFLLLIAVLTDVPGTISGWIVRWTYWNSAYLNVKISDYSRTPKDIVLINLVKILCFLDLICEIPTILGFFIGVFSVYRARELIEFVKAHSTETSERRAYVWRTLAHILIDCVCWILMSFLYISYWRRNEIFTLNPSSEDILGNIKRMFLLLDQSVKLMMFDLPFMFLCVLLNNTCRKYSVENQLRLCTTYGQRRNVILKYSILIWLDLLCFWFGVLVVLGSLFLRTSRLMNVLREGIQISIVPEQRMLMSWEKSLMIHYLILCQVMYFLIDIPFLIFEFVLVVFHWRWISMNTTISLIEKALKTSPDKDNHSSNAAIFWLSKRIMIEHLLLVLLDICSIIPFICCMFSWRAKQLWERIQWTLSVTAIGENTLISQQVHDYNINILIAKYNLPVLSKKIENQSKLKIRTILNSELNEDIFHQFGSLLLDLPFAGLCCLLLWRLPYCLWMIYWHQDRLFSSFKFSRGTITPALPSDVCSVRLFIFSQFLELLRDLPYVPLVIWNLICIWRIRSWVAIYYIPKRSKDIRKYILCGFYASLMDGISIILGTIMTITLWKALRVISILIHHVKSGANLTLRDKANSLLRNNGITRLHDDLQMEFTQWCNDLPYIPFVVFLAICPYRLYIFLGFVFDYHSLSKKLLFLEHCKQVLRTWHFRDDLRIVQRLSDQPAEERLKRKKYYKTCRSIGIACFLMGVEDYLLIVVFFGCLFSGWRTINFLEELYESPTKKTVLRQARYALADIRSAVQLLVIILCLVRIPALVQGVFLIWKESRRRKDRIFLAPFYWRKFQSFFVREVEKQENHLSHLEQLPNELIFQIAGYLEYSDIGRWQQTATTFRWALQDQLLWKHQLEKLAPNAIEVNSKWTYKRQLKCHVLKNRKKNNQSTKKKQLFLYDKGCRYVIQTLSVLSITRFHHTLLLPAKVMFYFTVALDKILRKVFGSYYHRYTISFDNRYNFWSCHRALAHLSFYAVYPISVMTMLVLGYQSFFWFYWNVFTLGFVHWRSKLPRESLFSTIVTQIFLKIHLLLLVGYRILMFSLKLSPIYFWWTGSLSLLVSSGLLVVFHIVHYSYILLPELAAVQLAVEERLRLKARRERWMREMWRKFTQFCRMCKGKLTRGYLRGSLFISNVWKCICRLMGRMFNVLHHYIYLVSFATIYTINRWAKVAQRVFFAIVRKFVFGATTVYKVVEKVALRVYDILCDIISRVFGILCIIARKLAFCVKSIYKLLENLALRVYGVVCGVVSKVYGVVCGVVSKVYGVLCNIGGKVMNALQVLSMSIYKLIYWLVMRILKRLAGYVIFAKGLLRNIKKALVYCFSFSTTVTKGVFEYYKDILVGATLFCAKLPDWVGNILLIPVCLIWMFWPMIVVCFINYYLLLPATLVSAVFLKVGYKLVDRNWN
jgi:hypothetical protein